MRGRIISQVDRYIDGFCFSQRIFPPQIIQVLLFLSSWTALDTPPLGRLSVGAVVHRRAGPLWMKHHPHDIPCHDFIDTSAA